MPITSFERIAAAVHSLGVVFNQRPREADVRGLGLWSRSIPTRRQASYELAIQAAQFRALIQKGRALGPDPDGNTLKAMADSAGKIAPGTFDSLLAIGLANTLPEEDRQGALWAMVACIQKSPQTVSPGLVLTLSTRGLSHPEDLCRRRATDILQQIAWFAPDKIGLVALGELHETGIRFKDDVEWVRAIGETLLSVVSHSPDEIVVYQAVDYLWDLRRQVPDEEMKALLVNCIKQGAAHAQHASVQSAIIKDLDRGGFLQDPEQGRPEATR